MNLTDIMEQIREKGRDLFDQIEKHPTYDHLKEKYMDLPTPIQRSINFIALILGIWLLFSFPLSYINSSRTEARSYEERHKLIEGLMKYGQTAPTQSYLPQGDNVSQMINSFRSELRSLSLLPEQMVGVTELPLEEFGKKLSTPPVKQSNFKVDLKWLNLQQIIEIGSRLQNLKTHIKLLGLDIQEDNEKKDYYNVTYKFAALSLPAIVEKKDKDKGNRTKRKGKSRAQNRKNRTSSGSL